MGPLPCRDFVRPPFCLQNIYGSSALHYAARWGYLAIAKRLLEGGADATLRNQDGKTALDWARQMGKSEVDKAREHGKSEVVALLSEPRYAMETEPNANRMLI